jgi:5-methyltetrahydropteroyltriglutamate--homocysteine methyltransferase
MARNVPTEEFRFLKQVASKPGKVALIGPDRISQRFDWQKSTAVYSGLDEFVNDVVKVEREIITGLVDAGCRYVQIDAPGYTAYVDRPSLDAMRARGEDPKENFSRS